MSEELKSTQIVYGENVLMMRVDDCLIFGNKNALRSLAEKLTEIPSAEPEQIIKIGQRSGKTLESAIDYLQSTGWLQEHDRILTESAEPERKKGKWMYKPNEYDGNTYECSRCGEPWTLIEGTPKENNMNYCPNCGAKLDWSEL